MIIYLDVPYSDKEDAKAMGCQWDSKKRQWFADTQDIHQFSKWFVIWTKPECKPKKVKPVSKNCMTFLDYLRHRHPTVNSLTKSEADIIGINYPLESGWVKKFGSINIYPETFERLEKARLARYASDAYQNKKPLPKTKKKKKLSQHGGNWAWKPPMESGKVFGITGNKTIVNDGELPWNE